MHAVWQTFLREAAGGPQALDTAARRCAALTDLAVLELTGPDAATFMQGYLTADLERLSESHAVFGAYCDIKGRVIADLLIVGAPDALVMVTHASLATPIVDSLAKYLMFSKSALTDARDRWLTLGLLGGDADAEPWAVQREADCWRVAIPGVGARWLCIAHPDRAAALWASFGIDVGNAEAWVRADIASRLAHVQAATSGEFLPQMLGYGELDAISFTKGCYLGQEVVTRAEHRGHVKRRLARFQHEGTPPAGADVLDEQGRRCGAVVQAVPGELLAVVSEDRLGAALSVAGERITAPG